jgi:transcriptional regulator with GAF, ATPase, and Fis domain
MSTQNLQSLLKATHEKAFLTKASTNRVESFEVIDFMTIGRDEGNQIILNDPFISGKHARVERKNNQFLITDLRSRNGLFVNGTRVLQAYLKDTDRIQIGQSELVFKFDIKNKSNHIFWQTKNPVWAKQLEQIPLVAKTNWPVLLQGPSGSGKEVLARQIHENSSRSQGPFVSLNCSTLSENLIESELFGHVKGSFTGAETDRKGAFEAARGGTLFLDEIGDLPPNFQPKLLRALENNEIKPIGSDQTKTIDVRIVAATHKNLKEKVSKNQFREDLYFRLHVIQLKLPSLNERMEDFEMLLNHFCAPHNVSFSDEALGALQNHYWKGNIRELKNFVARVSTFFSGKTVHKEDLNLLLEKHLDGATHPALDYQFKNQKLSIIKEMEKKMIYDSLVENNGNQTKSAVELGIPKSTLHDKIKSYGINVKEIAGKNHREA